MNWTLNFTGILYIPEGSPRSWRNFARECFCFGGEAVNASGEAVSGLVKSRISLAASPLAKSLDGGSAAARPFTNPASYAGYPEGD